MSTHNKQTAAKPGTEARPRSKKENAWVDDDTTEKVDPNATFLAALELARQGMPTTSERPSTPPRAPQEEEREPEPTESRSHLVKHRAPRAENEAEQFDNVYKRDTYYIDRTHIKTLKELIRSSGQTKTALMNEALELLFEKYGAQ